MKEKPYLEEQQRLWLSRIQEEYLAICRQHGIDLVLPVLAVTSGTRALGSWSAATRTIGLSRRLITNHSWEVGLQVLRHEMAHQYCTEVLGLLRGDHGREFHRACHLLGVLPAFRRGGVHLEEAAAALDDPNGGPARPWPAKVAKLLALASSPNEHEAALAMAKARELLEKYHIEALEALGPGQGQEHTFVVINRRRKQIATFQKHICAILQEFFMVRVVLSHSYSCEADVFHRSIELMGTRENVVVALYCYDFLENQLARLWRSNRHRFQGSARTEKNSYYLGLLHGFAEKLRRERRESPLQEDAVQPSQCRQLVALAERALDDFVAMRYPRLNRRSGRSLKVYGNTFREGVERGGRMTFHRGITEESGPSGRLLGGPCKT